MVEEGKKISFGFSKSIKKPVLKNTPPVEEKKVDFIECIDSKTIKVIGGEAQDVKKEPLVIKLREGKKWHDRIVNKTNADIFINSSEKVDTKDNIDKILPDIKIKQEKQDDVSDNSQTNISETLQNIEIKKEPDIKKEISLDEQAARDILNDVHLGIQIAEQTPQGLVIESNLNDELLGKEQSTIADYEEIPIESFGLAMLRGMGWKDNENEKQKRELQDLQVRPKGMGLGADKLLAAQKKKKIVSKAKEDEDLPLVKGSYVQLTKSKKYGQVQGFDDNSGRLIIKLTISGEIISANEATVQVVSKDVYSKNSKVINTKEYEDYKSNENSNNTSDHNGKSDSRHDKKKSSSKSRRYSSSDDSESEDDKKSPERRKKKTHKKYDYKNERSNNTSKENEKSESRRDKKSKSSSSKSRRYSTSSSSSDDSEDDKRSHKRREKTHKKHSESSSRRKDRDSREREKTSSRKSKKHKRSYSPPSRR